MEIRLSQEDADLIIRNIRECSEALEHDRKLIADGQENMEALLGKMTDNPLAGMILSMNKEMSKVKLGDIEERRRSLERCILLLTAGSGV